MKVHILKLQGYLTPLHHQWMLNVTFLNNCCHLFIHFFSETWTINNTRCTLSMWSNISLERSVTRGKKGYFQLEMYIAFLKEESLSFANMFQAIIYGSQKVLGFSRREAEAYFDETSQFVELQEWQSIFILNYVSLFHYVNFYNFSCSVSFLTFLCYFVWFLW